MRTLLVAGTELRRRIRNRSAIVTAFLGPLALAIVFSLLVGGAGVTFTVGVVDADGSPVTRELLRGLVNGEGEGSDAVAFELRADAELARAEVDDGDLDAALVVPEGFAAAAQQGLPATITVLRSPDRLVGGQIAESVALGIASRFERVGLALRTVTVLTGEPVSEAVVERAIAQPAALELEELSPGRGEWRPGAFYGAAMSILFLFFTVGFAARSLVAEQRAGTLGRILATPTRADSVLAGKTLAVSALGLAGFATVWVVTSLLFEADWGDPLGVALVMVATVLAIGGVSTFVASLARTEQQVDAYTAVVTFALALLGGNFVGPAAAPDLLKTLSLATPNGWALRAFTDLSADAASVGSVLAPLGILLGIGLAFGAVGVVRVRRRLSP